jgi:STE24 endopeptidase
MFSQLFFLMLVSLVTAIAIDAPSPTGIAETSPVTLLLQGCFIYFSAIAALCGINRYIIKGYHASIGRIVFFDNIVIVSALAILLLYLDSFRILLDSGFPLAKTVTAAVSLFLYFGALYACNYAFFRRHKDAASAHKKAIHAVQFIAPFALPLLGATIFLDLFGENPAGTGIGAVAVFLGIVLLTMIFLPPAIVWVWDCPPLKNDALTARLDVVCARTHFTHAGYRLWTVAEDSITAAIVGLVGRFRYILFTKKLLEKMPETSLEAILAHEIGHNKRKHLWIYPWILFGMLVFASAVSDWTFRSLNESRDIPEEFWIYIELAAFVAAMALYFRFVFGFFSRLFERQADLYVYEAGIDPNNLIEAFQQLARALGTSENDPSWHHFSIRERINFLRETQEDRTLIGRHHRNVYICLAIFTVILITTIYFTGIS